MDASYKIQRGIHVHLIQFFMCPEFWVHIKRAFVFLVFRGLFGGAAKWQAIRVWPHSEIFAGRRPAKMLVGELPKPAGLRDKLSQSSGAMRLLSAACRYRSWALFSRPSVTPSR